MGVRFIQAAAVALALVLAEPGTSRAFSLINGAWGERAAVWANGHGLEDGIDVGVAAGFEAALGITDPLEIDLFRQAVLAAFGSWENPALRFNVSFDASTTVDPGSGFELDLMALPYDHEAFGGDFLFGLATWQTDFGLRTLTNGVTALGSILTGTDIYLNTTAIAVIDAILVDDEDRTAAITRLLMHEIGHTVGVAHPFMYSNWDTDEDPHNAMEIDPLDPWSTLRPSEQLAEDAVMRVRPCGSDFINCPPLYYTSLTFDELGARDALYPVVPEPSAAALLASLAALGSLQRGRPRRLRAGAHPARPDVAPSEAEAAALERV